MTLLHNPKISRRRRIIGYAISVMATSILGFSAMVKLVGSELMGESIQSLNMEHIIVYIGVIEVICIFLYWFPKTSNIGFFLLCTFMGGIIACELIMGYIPPTASVTITIMIFVGTLLRKPELLGFDVQ